MYLPYWNSVGPVSCFIFREFCRIANMKVRCKLLSVITWNGVKNRREGKATTESQVEPLRCIARLVDLCAMKVPEKSMLRVIFWSIQWVPWERLGSIILQTARFCWLQVLELMVTRFVDFGKIFCVALHVFELFLMISKGSWILSRSVNRFCIDFSYFLDPSELQF